MLCFTEDFRAILVAAVKQRQTSWIPMVNGHILMVCKSEI